jgi:hypothetical protein
MKNPFKTAEAYIQIRKKCQTDTWEATIKRINDMILMPLIILCLLLLGKVEWISGISTFFRAFQSWKEWKEFIDLRFQVQEMFLITMKSGGPVITTNNSDYMPYVFADATYRYLGMGKSLGGRLEG